MKLYVYMGPDEVQRPGYYEAQPSEIFLHDAVTEELEKRSQENQLQPIKQKKTEADKLFEASIAVTEYEMRLHETLGNNFIYTDFTYDHYDKSLEIFGVPHNKTLTKEEQRRLRNFGFSQVWTHARKDRNYTNNHPNTLINEGERHYVLMTEEEKQAS